MIQNKKKMTVIGAKQHFWTYQGYDVDTGGEYSHCDRCDKYRLNGKPISKSAFLKRWEAGKVKIS
jgi:hypothetical protein